VNGINSAIDWIKSLPSEAIEWGRDMINGFINGIKSMINSITNTVKNVANTIRSYLHFSAPDEGPLSDYESWMPDFMAGLAKGIEDNKKRVQQAIQGITKDIKTTMTVRNILQSDLQQNQQRINSTNTFTFNINGTSDAQKTANEIIRILKLRGVLL
jgi:phage-related protein